MLQNSLGLSVYLPATHTHTNLVLFFYIVYVVTHTRDIFKDVFFPFVLIVFQPLLGAVLLHFLCCNTHTHTRHKTGSITCSSVIWVTCIQKRKHVPKILFKVDKINQVLKLPWNAFNRIESATLWRACSKSIPACHQRLGLDMRL